MLRRFLLKNSLNFEVDVTSAKKKRELMYPWGAGTTVLGGVLSARRASRHAVTRSFFVPLSDGSILTGECDAPAGEPLANVLLVHGLGSSCHDPAVRRQSSFLAAAGFQVFRLNHRNVGSGRGKAKGFYHGDRSQDLLEAFEALAEKNPGTWIIVGQSLSGNMVLKLAGTCDAAGRLRTRGCAGVVAISPVVDLRASSAAMGKSLNGFIDRVFIKRVQRYLKTNSHVASAEHIRAGLECRTLAEFDARFVAPALGLNHVSQYYDRASAAEQLASIALPTQVFIACDDPIAAGSVKTLRHAASPHLSVKETARGGHLAFLGISGASLAPQFLIDGWVAEACADQLEMCQ